VVEQLILGFVVLFHGVQAHLQRATDTAARVDDQRFLSRSKSWQQPLLSAMTATAESYLKQYMRRVGSVSKINQQYWQIMALPEVNDRSLQTPWANVLLLLLYCRCTANVLPMYC
jgi:hypothetical protein